MPAYLYKNTNPRVSDNYVLNRKVRGYYLRWKKRSIKWISLIGGSNTTNKCQNLISITSMGSPSINDDLHLSWHELIELLQVFGIDCCPSHSSDFFQAHILDNRPVLLVTFKRIKLEMPDWSHFKEFLKLFQTATNFLQIH